MLTGCTVCPCAQTVEGIVVDVGWYRTTIRSFEREIFNIPNSVFSRNVVLNITRKQKEWRFYEFIGAACSPVYYFNWYQLPDRSLTYGLESVLNDCRKQKRGVHTRRSFKIQRLSLVGSQGCGWTMWARRRP